jgi:hypothetical protein
VAAPAADPRLINSPSETQRPRLHVRPGRLGIGFAVCYGDEAVTSLFQDEAAAKHLCAYWETYIATTAVLPDWSDRRRWPVQGMLDAIAAAEKAAAVESELAESRAWRTERDPTTTGSRGGKAPRKKDDWILCAEGVAVRAARESPGRLTQADVVDKILDCWLDNWPPIGSRPGIDPSSARRALERLVRRLADIGAIKLK